MCAILEEEEEDLSDSLLHLHSSY